MASESLYETMQLIDDLSLRLKTSTYNQSDITFLAETLKSICDGVDPEEALDIKQCSGDNRADFRKHQRNASAIKKISAHTNILEASFDEDGKLVVYEVPKSMVPKLGKVTKKVAKEVGLDEKTLKQYWKNGRYKKYKNPGA